MSNDGNNGDEGFYSPEAFAMAAWGLLTVMVEKLKELDPDFDARAIRLFDHFLGRTIGGAKYLNKPRAAIWPRTESLGGDL
jgi:hypothetical protein